MAHNIAGSSSTDSCSSQCEMEEPRAAGWKLVMFNGTSPRAHGR